MGVAVSVCVRLGGRAVHVGVGASVAVGISVLVLVGRMGAVGEGSRLGRDDRLQLKTKQAARVNRR